MQIKTSGKYITYYLTNTLSLLVSFRARPAAREDDKNGSSREPPHARLPHHPHALREAQPRLQRLGLELARDLQGRPLQEGDGDDDALMLNGDKGDSDATAL